MEGKTVIVAKIIINYQFCLLFVIWNSLLIRTYTNLLYLCPFIFFIFNARSNIRTTNPRHYRSSITTLHVSRRRARKKIRQRTDMHAVLADTALFCEHARLYTEKKKSVGVKMKRIGGDARERMTER